MQICHEESSPRCLVYREPPSPWLGAAIATLGPLVGLAVAAFVATRGLDGLSLFAAMFGVFVLVLSLISGIWTMSDYRLLLNKAERQVIKSWTLFSLGYTKRRPLGNPTRVGWTVETTSNSTGMGSTSSRSYPIRLYESGGYPSRKLYLLASWGYPSRKLFTARSPDEARRLTCEVAEFLDIDQSHWDDEIRGLYSAAARVARAVGLSPAIRRHVDRSGCRLTLRKESLYSAFILGLLGAPFVLTGMLIALLPVLDGASNVRGDFEWELILVGLAILVLGLTIALGRRGTTIDKREQVVRSWWGPLGPLWSFEHDLSRFSTVGFDRTLSGAWMEEDRPEGCVYLQGEGEPDLVLHRSTDLDGARSLAEEVSQFLGWKLAAEPPGDPLLGDDPTI